jgi:hypothetical protein
MRRPELTRKEQYLLILGVSLAFLVQVIYDFAHQFADVLYNGIGTNWYWIILEGALFAIFAAFSLVLLSRMEQKRA